MTTALERLKKEFPDWKDWPQGAVEATVKMMQEYATEAIKADREQIIKANPVDCGFMNDSKKYEGYLLEDEIRKLPINLY